MNNKFNLIIPFIKKCETDIERHRRTFTKALEKDPNKLDQWINYLSEADILQAAIAVSELKNKDKKYINLLTNKLATHETNYQTILALLYLNQHDQIIKRYNELKSETIDKDEQLKDEFDYAEYDEEFTEETIIEHSKLKDEDPTKVNIIELYVYSPIVDDINRKIYSNLIEKYSDYTLIIDYILDLTKSNQHQAIYKLFSRIDKITITETISNKIKEIISILIKKQEYILALQSLKFLKLDYEEYTGIKNAEYITYLEENYTSLSALTFIKELALKEISIKDYFNKTKNNLYDNEHVVDNLKTILELIIMGDNPYDYEDEIKKINEYYMDKSLYVYELELNGLFENMFNQVIKNIPEELINVVKMFDHTNPYRYNVEQKSIVYLKVKNKYTSSNKLLNIVDNVTGNSKLSDKDKIFIYMNTHMKILINLTDYLYLINPKFKGDSNTHDVEQWFKDYIFYAVVISINYKNDNGRVRNKLINVLENNKIRGSLFSIEKYTGTKLVKYKILATKITTFRPSDNSFKLIYLKDEKNTEKQDYEKIYIDLANNKKIAKEVLDKEKIGQALNFYDVKEINNFFEVQIKALKELSNNYKNYIEVLKRDFASPFKWKNSGALSIESLEQQVLKSRMDNYYKDHDGVRTDVYQSIVSLIQSTASLEEIIYIYMNTLVKHNISINDLFKLLIKNQKFDTVPHTENKYDIEELFKDYQFKGKIISYDEEEKLTNFSCHLLWNFHLCSTTLNNPKDYLQSHKYIKFKLKFYDSATNIIEVTNITKSKHSICDYGLIYLDKILISIRKENNIDNYIDQIKNVTKIALLDEQLTLGTKKDIYNSVRLHLDQYIATLSKFIENLEDVEKFLKALGANNILIYPRHFNDNDLITCRRINSYSRMITVFSKSFIHSNNLRRLLYIYLNSIARQTLSLNKLLKTFCDHHNVINRELDLSCNETPLYIAYKHGAWTLKYVNYDCTLAFDQDLDIEKEYIVNFKTYHPVTNVLKLEIIKKKD